MGLIVRNINFTGNFRGTFPQVPPPPPGPNIVTSGLIMNLDAGNSSSYSGSGTTWNDLSGNGNNGTLVNGPTYNSASGGSIVFDGVDDYVGFNSLGSVTDWTVSLMLAGSNKTFAEVIYPFGFTTSGQFSGGIDVGGWALFLET